MNISAVMTMFLNRNYDEAAKEILRYGAIIDDKSEQIDGNHSRYQAIEFGGERWKLVKHNGQVIHLSN